MTATPRRRLVVVRAGDLSLHPSWLKGGEPPTFDLAVSYYGDDPSRFHDAPLRHHFKGGKWDGIHAFFSAHRDLLERYDWIWLPDDDIETTAASINRLFDVAEQYQLALAQPALTWDSYFTHLVTLQNRKCMLRWVNYVEVMVPIFSSDLLRRVLPVFAEHRYGWGMEFLLPRWMPDPALKTAIIDTVTVRHTRPVGTGPLNSASGAAERESELFRQKYLFAFPNRAVFGTLDANGENLKRGFRFGRIHFSGWLALPRHVVYRAIDGNGRKIKRGLRLILTMYLGWAALRHKVELRRKRLTTRLLLRHVVKLCVDPMNLTPLTVQSDRHAPRRPKA